MLGTIPSFYSDLMHFIPIRALGERRYSCLQFINEETAAKGDEITCLIVRPHCDQVTDLGFEPRQPDPSAILTHIMLHHHSGYFYAHYHMSSFSSQITCSKPGREKYSGLRDDKVYALPHSSVR